MKGIELPIIFHTDETLKLHEIGVEYSDDDCIVRDIVFYQISGITVSYDKGKPTKQTCIYANGETYLSTLPISEVRKIIES